MMTLHALGTSTSCMALRLIRRAMDREPRVATSLCVLDVRWAQHVTATAELPTR